MQPQSSGFLIIWLIVSVCFFAVATQSVAQTKLEKLHVGYSAQAGSLAPIWITKEAGIFIGAKDKTLKIYDDPKAGGTIHCSRDYWAHHVPFMLDWLEERL